MEVLTEKVGIASLNINGLQNPIKRNNIFKHFKNTNIDIICLQETHIVTTDFSLTKSEWNGPLYWNPGTNVSCGVGILLNPHKKFEVLQTLQDQTGRILNLKLKYKHQVFQVCTVYAPDKPTLREHFFTTLANYLIPNIPLILNGDFNMVEDPHLDRQCPTILPQHTKGLTALTQLKTQFHLLDGWRQNNPKQRQYTWPTKQHDVQSRLDRIYISTDLNHQLIHQDFMPTVWSDHKYITTHLYLMAQDPRGPNYWKLNTEVLTETEYKELITNIIQQHVPKQSDYPDILQWWDSLKNRIRTETIKYCKQRARIKRGEITNVKQTIDTETHQQRPNTAKVDDLYSQLHELQRNRDRGTIIRSREKTILNNEQPTKYFFTQEHNRQEKKKITKLRLKTDTDNDTDTTEYATETTEILTEIHKHYTALYNEQPPCPLAQQHLLHQIHKSIPNTTADKIDDPIQTTELTETLKQMELNKTPGIDGLPTEFYNTFWEELKQVLTTVAHYIYTDRNQCSATQKRAIISLLYKDDEKEILDNWRPISLLCTDYKLITKTLANRLTPSLHHILHEDQTCTVPTRSIYDNLYLIREIIHHTHTKSRHPTYLLAMDIQKAFDSVDHNFLILTLKKFGYGPTFIQFIQNSYTNITANVMNNGYMTLNIRLRRGLRQGCPLSLILYCIIAETLANEIRSNTKIKGYHAPGTPEPTKITQYADDTVLITSDVSSIHHTLASFDIYYKASGCKLKQSKLKGLIVGHNSDHSHLPDQINWVNSTGLKILGVVFFNDPLYTINHNWQIAITKLTNKLSKLRYRTLSLRGKAILINTLALSQIWFLASLLHIPKWALTAIEKQIFTFLWDDKRMEPIKRKTLYLPPHLGGLGILHPLLQSQALTLKYFMYITEETKQTKWLLFARYWMSLRLAKYDNKWSFLKTNSTPKYNGTDPPLHWQKSETTFIHHKTQIIQTANKTAKKLYQVLRTEYYKQHTITSENVWDRTFHTILPWKKLWTHTYQSHARGRIDDTLFRILHNSYPTGAKMHNSRQRGHFNPNCKYCTTSGRTQLETTLHIFARCPFATKIWQHYKPIYTTLQPNTPYIYENIVLTLDLATNQLPKPTSTLLLTITSFILTELWTVRNKFKFDRIIPNHQRSTKTINAHITYMLTTHFKHHKNLNTLSIFQDKFLINNALGAIERNELTVTLPI